VKDPKALTIDGMENFDTDNMYEYTEESKPVSVVMTHEHSNNQYAADASSMN